MSKNNRVMKILSIGLPVGCLLGLLIGEILWYQAHNDDIHYDIDTYDITKDGLEKKRVWVYFYYKDDIVKSEYHYFNNEKELDSIKLKSETFFKEFIKNKEKNEN